MPLHPHNRPNPHPTLVIFDDQRGRFGPMTDRRACFDLRTGILTTRQRIEAALGISAVALHVADQLADVVAERETEASVNRPLPPGHYLLVNGRLSNGFKFPLREQWADAAAIIDEQDQVLCAYLPHDRAQALLDNGCRWRDDLGESILTRMRQRSLLERPWHILDDLEAVLKRDLAHCAPPHLASSARVHPTAVLDDTAGSVVLAADTVIGPLAVLEGPCYIGPGSVVQPHSYIRPNTVVGENCKVAGEISFSIIHGHTNKAHYGYLGHALVGEWVNLGAGTTVSNLKNTYGEVRVQVGDAPEATGRTSQGPILGDFVRTAIGTLIPTGACIGTGCMVAVSGFAPKHAPAGGFYTDAGRQAYDAEKLLATARAMMARRRMALSAAEEGLLRAIVAGGG